MNRQRKTMGGVMAGLLAAMLYGGLASAEERPSIAFAQELNAIAKTWRKDCQFSYGWKDEGASCQNWIHAIDEAAARPETSAADKRLAANHRMSVRRHFGDGLIHHARKPERALKEYEKAFVEMRALFDAGESSIFIGGYEVLAGMARALHETGDSGQSDQMFQLARTVSSKLHPVLSQTTPQLNPGTKARILQVLDSSEDTEVRWAEYLTERAAKQAIAGNKAAAGALWFSAAKAYAQAADNLRIAVQAQPSRTKWELQIHPALRMASHHRLAGDHWLLVHSVAPDDSHLRSARQQYSQVQPHLDSVKEQLIETQPDIGYGGLQLHGSQFGLALALAFEGRLQEAAEQWRSVEAGLTPITRREMSVLAQQGKATKRWLWKASASSDVECNSQIQLGGKDFCKEVVPDVMDRAYDRVLEERLPRFSDRNSDAQRLYARLLSAKARWTKGDWKAAQAAWQRVRATVAADTAYLKTQMLANDEYQLLLVQNALNERGSGKP